MYLSFVAVTSGVVRDTMTFILAIFPTWVSFWISSNAWCRWQFSH
jgi:hypothetical protein